MVFFSVRQRKANLSGFTAQQHRIIGGEQQSSSYDVQRASLSSVVNLKDKIIVLQFIALLGCALTISSLLHHDERGDEKLLNTNPCKNVVATHSTSLAFTISPRPTPISVNNDGDAEDDGTAEDVDSTKLDSEEMQTSRKSSDSSRIIYPFAQWFEIRDPTTLLKGRPPGLVLDVGAHVGITVLQAARYGHRIIAFEPVLENCNALRKKTQQPHSAAPNNITLYCAGVAATTGWGRVKGADSGRVASDGSTSVGIFSVSESCNDDRADQEKDENRQTSNPCIKSYALDDVVQEHVLYMKIDVQGGELQVLKGATHLFDHYGVDAVFVEIAPGNIGPVEWLLDRGYTCMDFPYVKVDTTQPESPGRVRIYDGRLTIGNPFYYYVEKDLPFDVHDRLRTVLYQYAFNDYLCVRL